MVGIHTSFAALKLVSWPEWSAARLSGLRRNMGKNSTAQVSVHSWVACMAAYWAASVGW